MVISHARDRSGSGIVEAATCAIRRPGPLQDHFLGLRSKKEYRVAVVATARKMCTYIYHMLNEGKDFSAVTSNLRCDLGRPRSLDWELQ